jgi:hypothetical protein
MDLQARTHPRLARVSERVVVDLHRERAGALLVLMHGIKALDLTEKLRIA